MDIPVLQTERLVLRAMGEHDLIAFEATFTDERVYRWFGGEPPSRAEVWRSIAMHLGHWGLRGYGQWALENRSTGELVGRAGLWQPEGWPGLEVGWTVAPEHWRRGYASEAGAASVNWAFEHLGADEVISLTLPDNTASRGVMEKIGLVYDRTEPVAGHDQVVYRITYDEWSSRG